MAEVLKVSMDELGVPFGLVLQIELIATKERYSVKVVGCLPNKTLIVTAPRIDGKSVWLRETSIIKARFMMGTKVCAFASKVEKTCREPAPYLHLSYPDVVEASIVRSAARLDTSLITSVEPITEGSSVDKKVAAKLINLSVGGGRFTSKHDLGIIGEYCRMALKLNVEGFDEVIKVCSEICYREETTVQVPLNIPGEEGLTRPTSMFTFGVKFVDLTKEQVLLITAYIYRSLYEQGKVM
ncbi:hypothetical protein A9Q77_03995 [Marinomonas sp. 42_23_T18]|nr:hypothetical protein A9Q77_03995 [Marinomonas sp. 42_23_T18]